MSDQTNMPLPPKWSRTTIGVVIEDKVPQNGPSGDDTFTYVDIGGIENSTKRIVDPKLLSVGEAPSRAKQVLAADDVLVSMTRPNLNAVAKVPAELDGAIGSTGFHVLRTKIIEPSWLYYTVQSNDFVHAMCQVVQGALYPAVRPRDIRSYGLPIPPLNEQRRIVDKIEELFSDLDAGVAALTRAKANLKRYRASVLKAAVEGHLTAAWRAEHPGTEPASALLARILTERRQKWEADQLAKFTAAGKSPPKNWKDKYAEPSPPDTTNLPDLPDGWCWATMEQISSYQRNGYFQSPDGATSGTPILRINAVRPMKVDLAESRFLSSLKGQVDDYFIENGDLLFTRYNGSVELLGVAGMVRGCTERILHPDKLIRVKLVDSDTMPSYVEIAANVGESRKHMAGRARTTAGQTGISGGDVREMPIPVATLAEQRLIVQEVAERLSQIDAGLAQVEHGLLRAARLRQSILKQAFEGNLVPQDPTDEPASVLLERLRASQSPHECNGSVTKPVKSRGRRSKAELTKRSTGE